MKGEDQLEKAILQLNKTHAVVYVGGDALVIDEDARNAEAQPAIEFRSIAGFKDYYANLNALVEVERGGGTEIKEVNVARAWLKHPERRQYKSIVFDPSGKPSSDQVYNLWRGFAVDPRQGDCSLYWQHIQEVICADDHELYGYVRRWMAHAVQKTGQIPGTALVLRGLEGTGKNTFVDWFGRIFGNSYGAFNNMEKVLGRFSGHLKDKVVIYANEATWGGDKKQEGVLKAMVTDPTRDIEMKGRDIFTVKNFTRLIIASNNDWVVPVGLDSRRFVYCNVSPAKKGHYDDWFTPINAQMESGGLEALLYDLQQEDLSGWNPFVRPEGNEAAGFDMKVLSMSNLEKFILEWLYEDKLSTCPPAETHLGCYRVSFKFLYGEYTDYAERMKERHLLDQRSFAIKVFGPKAKPGGLLPPFLRYGKNDSEGRYYVLPNITECRKWFEERVVYQAVDWDTEDAPRARKIKEGVVSVLAPEAEIIAATRKGEPRSV